MVPTRARTEPSSVHSIPTANPTVQGTTANRRPSTMRSSVAENRPVRGTTVDAPYRFVLIDIYPPDTRVHAGESRERCPTVEAGARSSHGVQPPPGPAPRGCRGCFSTQKRQRQPAPRIRPIGAIEDTERCPAPARRGEGNRAGRTEGNGVLIVNSRLVPHGASLKLGHPSPRQTHKKPPTLDTLSEIGGRTAAPLRLCEHAQPRVKVSPRTCSRNRRCSRFSSSSSESGSCPGSCHRTSSFGRASHWSKARSAISTPTIRPVSCPCSSISSSKLSVMSPKGSGTNG